MKKDEIGAFLAQETLNILERGEYQLDGSLVDLKEDIKKAVRLTVLYSEDEKYILEYDTEEKLENLDTTETEFEVTEESSLEALSRINSENPSRVMVLNFASGVKVGGDFRMGFKTQEDEILISTCLYPMLSSKQLMYQRNRDFGSHLYTDDMIFSPDVPVIRDISGNLLSFPYKASFLSAPAVNKRLVLKNEPENVDEIAYIMRRRVEKMLSIALTNRCQILILGAWGCGVFGHDPLDVALYYKEFLKDGGTFENVFKKVVFPIYSKGDDHTNYDQFKKTFT